MTLQFAGCSIQHHRLTEVPFNILSGSQPWGTFPTLWSLSPDTFLASESEVKLEKRQWPWKVWSFNVMTSNSQLRGRERPGACSRVEETTAGPLLWYRTVKFTATVRTGWISTPNIPPESLLPPGNIFNRTRRKWKIKEFWNFCFFNCLEVIVQAHCLCQVIIYHWV